METSPSNSPTASSFMKTLGLSTLAVFAMAAAAQAVLIDMQFASTGNATQTGAAVVGTAGDVWNHSGNGTGTAVALITVAGTSSGVSLTWSGAGGVFNVNPSNSGFNGTQWAPLMSNYLYSSSSATVSLALTG